MTRFIRAHRADGPQRTGGKPGSDTGRLKGSFMPVVEDGGNRFGAATNVGYARQFQFGGMSQPSYIRIKSFLRKAPGRAVGFVRGQRVGMVRVRDYVMKMGGHMVPARRFFPRGMADLDTWGYLAKIRMIFAQRFGEAAAG